MCLLCASIAEGTIKWKEAARNLSEMELDAEHKKVVKKAIEDLALKEIVEKGNERED